MERRELAKYRKLLDAKATQAGFAVRDRDRIALEPTAEECDRIAMAGSGYPARPSDYREEHENCAPEEFVFREPLRGGEVVRITGVNAAGPLDFVLPKHRLVIEAAIDGATLERRPHLDTVVVDSDAMVLELVWRALFRCPTKMRGRFTSVQVQAKEFLA